MVYCGCIHLAGWLILQYKLFLPHGRTSTILNTQHCRQALYVPLPLSTVAIFSMPSRCNFGYVGQIYKSPWFHIHHTMIPLPSTTVKLLPDNMDDTVHQAMKLVQCWTTFWPYRADKWQDPGGPTLLLPALCAGIGPWGPGTTVSNPPQWDCVWRGQHKSSQALCTGTGSQGASTIPFQPPCTGIWP